MSAEVVGAGSTAAGFWTTHGPHVLAVGVPVLALLVVLAVEEIRRRRRRSRP